MNGKIKCTNCNSDDLFVYNSEGPATTYACRQCSHMEWFLNEDTMKLFLRSEKQDLLNEMAELQDKLKPLQSIINDQNQTLAAIRDAKEIATPMQERIQIITARIEKIQKSDN